MRTNTRDRFERAVEAPRRSARVWGFGVIVCLSLTACAPQFTNHGYIPPEDELALIEVGSDTRESVAEKIGVPASSGVLNEGGYYYVRMRTRAVGPFAPQEIDRQVLAISFSPAGVVQNVERFGLERGQVVALERRVTDSAVRDNSFLR
ncbi:MAG: outer membrane protein assembly factor BamE, partial [Pseudomonadota bacterium]